MTDQSNWQVTSSLVHVLHRYASKVVMYCSYDSQDYQKSHVRLSLCLDLWICTISHKKCFYIFLTETNKLNLLVSVFYYYQLYISLC